MKRYSIVLLAALLGGCASANVKPTFSMTEAAAKGHGLLVMSVSTDIPDTSFSADTRFRFDSLSPGAGAQNKEVSVSSHCGPEEKDFDGCGRLVAVELPAGTYRFWWQILPDLGYGAIIRPILWDDIDVAVQAGKVSYLGSLHMRLSTWGTVVGQEAKWGWPMAEDRSDRDIALLLQRYPNLKREDVLMQAMEMPPPGQTMEMPGDHIQNPPEAISSAGP